MTPARRLPRYFTRCPSTPTTATRATRLSRPWRRTAWQQREELAEQLRRSWQEGGIDPVLSTLRGLHEQRLQLEANMRLLMAYGRRFTSPRPYKLIDLARAAGLSISGVRIAFTDDEIYQAAEILGRPPVPDDGPVLAPE